MNETKEKGGCGYGIWILIAFLVIGAITQPEIFFGSVLLYVLGIASIFAFLWFIIMIFDKK